MIQEAVSKIQKLGIPPNGFEDVKFPGDNEFPSAGAFFSNLANYLTLGLENLF